jgi:hypothetical protein
MYTYILRLQTNTLVKWTGTTGPDAARRYAACHPDAVVEADQHAVSVIRGRMA